MKYFKLFSILHRMGLKYFVFRAIHELSRRSGLLRFFYPVNVPFRKFITLQNWRSQAKPFFIDLSAKIQYSQEIKEHLSRSASAIKSGNILFFTSKWIQLGSDYNWITNPSNGFQFDREKHWTRINEFNENQGDIKYVWEKSRFCYFLELIRNDFANNQDNSDFVWKEILSWVDSNRYNCGPNFKCSQEISLRILNWVFALYYYKNTETLTEEIFLKIINSIYWQTKHVEENILFSKIAVRNNHAITESLCLFTVGLLFPFFPNSKRWFRKGMKYLEEEGLYQIYEDGSYIQHSFNYQRAVVQLYTWAVALARKNNISFSDSLMDRLKKCVLFLKEFTNHQNGFVPNWGANDSALFFPLNSCDPRDFRPQINALCLLIFSGKPLYIKNEIQEDAFWFGITVNKYDNFEQVHKNPIIRSESHSFPIGGYHILQSQNGTAFIHCSNYRHRPFHADNLHLDIWYNNKNIVRDAGTYSYNTDPKLVNFFFGSAGHNTIMIDNHDQMEKGERFIWYKWSKALKTDIYEQDEILQFEGIINAFRQLNENIYHHRIVKSHKEIPLWVIHDKITGADGHRFSQIWNISEDFYNEGFNIKTFADDQQLKPETRECWYSEFYGQKKSAQQIIFQSSCLSFITFIYHSTFTDIVENYIK